MMQWRPLGHFLAVSLTSQDLVCAIGGRHRQKTRLGDCFLSSMGDCSSV